MQKDLSPNEIQAKLANLMACEEAIEWAEGKGLYEIWETCERGDWMLWLAKLAGINKRQLIAAKAECAALVKHLMKDPRSIKAIEVAQAYGRGEATDQELAYADDAAANAAYAAYANANDAAYAAAYAAANAAYAAAYAAADAAANAAAANAAYANAANAANANAAADVKKETLKKCAIIVRQKILVTDLII